jgi:hypothetical protein
MPQVLDGGVERTRAVLPNRSAVTGLELVVLFNLRNCLSNVPYFVYGCHNGARSHATATIQTVNVYAQANEMRLRL